jgi:hypothetical protein
MKADAIGESSSQISRRALATQLGITMPLVLCHSEMFGRHWWLVHQCGGASELDFVWDIRVGSELAALTGGQATSGTPTLKSRFDKALAIDLPKKSGLVRPRRDRNEPLLALAAR